MIKTMGNAFFSIVAIFLAVSIFTSYPVTHAAGLYSWTDPETGTTHIVDSIDKLKALQSTANVEQIPLQQSQQEQNTETQSLSGKEDSSEKIQSPLNTQQAPEYKAESEDQSSDSLNVKIPDHKEIVPDTSNKDQDYEIKASSAQNQDILKDKTPPQNQVVKNGKISETFPLSAVLYTILGVLLFAGLILAVYFLRIYFAERMIYRDAEAIKIDGYQVIAEIPRFTL